MKSNFSTTNFLKSIGLMSLMTLLSRFLGLARDMIRAFFLGTSAYSDAYILAFQIPNLFRRLSAEGAMLSAFIPVFTEVHHEKGKQEAFRFSSHFFWLLTIVLTLFTTVFILIAPWSIPLLFAPGFTGEKLQLTIFLTQIMFGYVILISLAAIFQGILNHFQNFWVSAFTPVLLNISIIICAVVGFHTLSNPTYGFAIGVLIGGFIQCCFQVPFVYKIGFRFFDFSRSSLPALKKTGKLILPGLFSAGIYQINIIVSNYIASGLGDGAISSLNYSNRMLEFVLGVFIVSIVTIILPQISTLVLEKKWELANQRISDAISLVSFITFPVIVGVWITGEELIELLFLRGEFTLESVRLTSYALLYHISGLIFIGWNRVLLSSYYAVQNMKKPVYIAGVTMIVNICFCIVLSDFMSHVGIAFANTISQGVQLFLLWWYRPKYLGLLNYQQLLYSILKHIFSAGILFLILFKIKNYFLIHWNIPIFYEYLIYLTSACIIYFIVTNLLKVKELKELLQFVKKGNA